MFACERGNIFDLALAEQCRGTDGAHAERTLGDNDDADGLGKSLGFAKPRLRRPPHGFAGQLRHDEDRPFAASDLDRAIAVEASAQDSSSASPGAGSPSFSGCAGWSVEMACL